MNRFTITPHADEVYTFMGEPPHVMNWGYANIAYSGYTKLYKTDNNNLVVEIKRWVDEQHLTSNTTHECVVLNIDEIKSRAGNTWVKRWMRGNSKDYIGTQIDKKVPYYMYPNNVFDSMLNIILYQLEMNPDMIKQV